VINGFSLKNIGPIDHFNWENTEKINLLLGPNGCGKTFILKMAYAVIRTIEEYKRGNDLRSDNEILAQKLYWTFQTDKIGDLIKKGADGSLQSKLWLDNNEFSFSFGKDTSKFVSNLKNNTQPRASNSVFLPAKETLSIHNIILETRQKDKIFGYDDTYFDLAQALQPPTKGKNYQEFSTARKNLEELIGGRIEYDANSRKWSFKKGNSRFSIGTTAEGIKKIAILDTLLGNRYLDTNSVIFIDEPEAALHPQAISEFLNILHLLSQTGIQIFMATHSYFVIKKLFLLAQENNMSIPTAFYDQNNWLFSNLRDEMPDNSIIRESVNLYKKEVELQFKK